MQRRGRSSLDTSLDRPAIDAGASRRPPGLPESSIRPATLTAEVDPAGRAPFDTVATCLDEKAARVQAVRDTLGRRFRGAAAGEGEHYDEWDRAAYTRTLCTSLVLVAALVLPLHGKTVVIDPGHNGGNWSHPAEINRLVDAGGFRKACDTTGTSTNDGYAEAGYNLDVALRLARILRAAGARVVLTRTTNDGCRAVRQRAGGDRQPCARGRCDLDPRRRRPGGRARLPRDLQARTSCRGRTSSALAIRAAFRAGTGEPYSTYAGRDALDVRTDLGGLNLSTVPKVFIETGNMRNASDAARLESADYREREAIALAHGLEAFLH